MATFSQKFRVGKPSSENEVIDALEDALSASLEYEVKEQQEGTLELSGKPSGNYFTVFDATFDIRIDKDAVRITGAVDTKPGDGFWVCMILGLFTGFMFIVGFILYFMSSGVPEKEINACLEALKTKMGE